MFENCFTIYNVMREIVCFIFGITFEQIFVKNSFAKAKKLVYNKVKSRKESKKTLKEKESSL